MPNDKKIPQLYSGERQHENFCRMEDFYHTATLKAASHIRPFPKGNDSVLPDTYRFEGETRKLSDLIQATDTSALLVLQDGEIRYEQYFLTGGPLDFLVGCEKFYFSTCWHRDRRRYYQI